MGSNFSDEDSSNFWAYFCLEFHVRFLRLTVRSSLISTPRGLYRRDDNCVRGEVRYHHWCDRNFLCIEMGYVCCLSIGAKFYRNILRGRPCGHRWYKSRVGYIDEMTNAYGVRYHLRCNLNLLCIDKGYVSCLSVRTKSIVIWIGMTIQSMRISR